MKLMERERYQKEKKSRTSFSLVVELIFFTWTVFADMMRGTGDVCWLVVWLNWIMLRSYCKSEWLCRAVLREMERILGDEFLVGRSRNGEW
jgi:hypothetical protein